MIFEIQAFHIWKPICPPQGRIWAPLGAILAPLRAILEHGVATWTPLGSLLGTLGALLGTLGALLGTFGGHVGSLLDPLGSSCNHLGPSWSLLEPFWGILLHFEFIWVSILSHLGSIWHQFCFIFGTIWHQFRTILGASGVFHIVDCLDSKCFHPSFILLSTSWTFNSPNVLLSPLIPLVLLSLLLNVNVQCSPFTFLDLQLTFHTVHCFDQNPLISPFLLYLCGPAMPLVLLSPF